MKVNTASEIREVQRFYNQRNNLFLRILILVKKYSKKEKEYYYKQIDSFIKANNENLVDIQIDVDYFFLSKLGYFTKGRNLLVKHNEYFKNLVKEYKYVDPLTFYHE
jgi:hypothetical protein